MRINFQHLNSNSTTLRQEIYCFVFLFVVFHLSTQVFSQDTTTLKIKKHNKYFGCVELDGNPLLLFVGQGGVSIINGYKFNQYFYLGAVTGFSVNYTAISKPRPEAYYDSLSNSYVTYKDTSKRYSIDIPIGLTIRGNIGKKKARFFYSLSSGFVISVNSKMQETVTDYYPGYGYYTTTSRYVKWFMNPSIGTQIFANDKVNFIIALSSFMTTTHLYKSTPPPTANSIYVGCNGCVHDFFPSLGLKFGVGWE